MRDLGRLGGGLIGVSVLSGRFNGRGRLNLVEVGHFFLDGWFNAMYGMDAGAEPYPGKG